MNKFFKEIYKTDLNLYFTQQTRVGPFDCFVRLTTDHNFKDLTATMRNPSIYVILPTHWGMLIAFGQSPKEMSCKWAKLTFRKHILVSHNVLEPQEWCCHNALRWFAFRQEIINKPFCQEPKMAHETRRLSNILMIISSKDFQAITNRFATMQIYVYISYL